MKFEKYETLLHNAGYTKKNEDRDVILYDNTSTMMRISIKKRLLSKKSFDAVCKYSLDGSGITGLSADEIIAVAEIIKAIMQEDCKSSATTYYVIGKEVNGILNFFSEDSYSGGYPFLTDSLKSATKFETKDSMTIKEKLHYFEMFNNFFKDMNVYVVNTITSIEVVQDTSFIAF